VRVTIALRHVALARSWAVERARGQGIDTSGGEARYTPRTVTTQSGERGEGSRCYARTREEYHVLVHKPSPCELAAPINPDRGVEGHRNLYCGFYDGCLDESVKKGWNSWSCTRCDGFALQPETTEGGLESYATQRRLG
jgi:hypothetical protein